MILTSARTKNPVTNHRVLLLETICVSHVIGYKIRSDTILNFEI